MGLAIGTSVDLASGAGSGLPRRAIALLAMTGLWGAFAFYCVIASETKQSMGADWGFTG